MKRLTIILAVLLIPSRALLAGDHPASYYQAGPKPGETSQQFWARQAQGVALGILPTQRPPRALPSNWIDPELAAAKFREEQLLQAIEDLRRSIPHR